MRASSRSDLSLSESSAAEEWKKQLLQSSEDSDGDDDAGSDDEHEELRSLTGVPATHFVLKPSHSGSVEEKASAAAAAEDWSQYGEVDGGYQRPQQRLLNGLHMLCTRIPYYVPILSWLPAYRRDWLMQDVIAGLTVGVMLVPQGLTYAGLASLPPIYGLYSAFFPLIVYVVMGSSRHLSVGPEVTTSILIGKTVLEAAGRLPNDADPDDDGVQLQFFVPIAMALTLLIGLFSFFLGLIRLGFLDSILSRPILAGFINAVALTLIAEQANTLLGVQHKGGDSPADSLLYALSHLSSAHLLTFLISGLCCCTFFTFNYVKRSYPSNRVLQCIPDVLLVVVLVTAASYLLDFQSRGVSCLSIKSTGFRRPSIPSLSDFGSSFLVTSALTITLLGFVESQLVSKKFATKHGYSISPNRELVALGIGNIVGSFFGAYCAFGSIARTKVSELAGCRSNMVNLVAAMVTLVSILVLLPMFAYTPRAVTSSIIFSVAVGLVEVHELRFITRVKSWKDLTLMFAMTFVTFVFGVDTGVFFAFASCLLVVVKKTTRPGVTLLGRGFQDDQFGQMTDLEKAVQDIEGILIYKLEGPLYFANAEKLKDSTRRMERYGGFHVHPSEAPKPMQLSSIVFDMSSLTSIDASALQIMEEILLYYLVQERRRVCLVKVPRKVLYKFQLAGILELVGFENLYRTLEDVFTVIRNENLSNLSHSNGYRGAGDSNTDDGGAAAAAAAAAGGAGERKEREVDDRLGGAADG